MQAGEVTRMSLEPGPGEEIPESGNWAVIPDPPSVELM